MKSSFLTRVLTTSGFVLGAFALAAVAATWTAPTATPPNGNVDAPINVGLMEQTKTGPLVLNSLSPSQLGLRLSGKIQIVDGNQAAGKVLTSDASGIGSWATPTGGSGGTGGGSWGRIYTYHATGVTFTNGVSNWINISLPNGDVMTAAHYRYGGRNILTMSGGWVDIDNFEDRQTYVEVDQANSRLRVHLINNDHVTPYTGPSSAVEVYLTIYTGSPGEGTTSTGTIRGYGTATYDYSSQAALSCNAVATPFSCSGTTPLCPAGWQVISAGNQYGSCAGSTCSKIYSCVKI